MSDSEETEERSGLSRLEWWLLAVVATLEVQLQQDAETIASLEEDLAETRRDNEDLAEACEDLRIELELDADASVSLEATISLETTELLRQHSSSESLGSDKKKKVKFTSDGHTADSSESDTESEPLLEESDTIIESAKTSAISSAESSGSHSRGRPLWVDSGSRAAVKRRKTEPRGKLMDASGIDVHFEEQKRIFEKRIAKLKRKHAQKVKKLKEGGATKHRKTKTEERARLLSKYSKASQRTSARKREWLKGGVPQKECVEHFDSAQTLRGFCKHRTAALGSGIDAKWLFDGFSV